MPTLKTRWALAAAIASMLSAAQAAGVPGQGTWESVLQARDLNADGVVDAYYDSSRGLSWLADADPIGANDWQTTQSWVAALNVHGVGGWRLPTLQAAVGGVLDCPDYSYDGSGDCGYNVDPARSELAHMFQVVLGNTPEVDTSGQPVPTGWGLTNTGPFAKLRAGDYPTAETWIWNSPQGPELYVWLFQTHYGYQDRGVAGDPTHHAWAVHDGDVALAVPEPGTWALWLAGLALVGRLGRRRRA